MEKKVLQNSGNIDLARGLCSYKNSLSGRSALKPLRTWVSPIVEWTLRTWREEFAISLRLAV
jgi:hypothetical protein